ncbi:6-phospho-beta-glucosidase, partial [Faecalibaculum rodentium]
VILDIVEDMKELCPDAWLVNFTNPSGMVTEAVMKYGHWDKVAGLCNVPVIAMMSEPEAIGKTPEDLTYRFAGLNHFHWHRVWDETGREVTRDLIEAFERLGRTPGMPANIFDVPFYREQLDLMGMIPCGYHRYYYRQQEMLEHMLEEAQSQAGTRAEQVKQTEDELFELYKDPNLDHKPEQLARRGGAHYSDAACETIASLYADKNTHIVLTTRNNGAIPDLPEDVAVEVSTLVGKDGPKVIPFGALPAGERGLLQVMKAMEQCVEEAAVTGNVGALLEAFTLNPLITAGETARQVMNELLVAHERYLPQFASTIAELKRQGVTVKDERVRRLMEEGQ